MTTWHLRHSLSMNGWENSTTDFFVLSDDGIVVGIADDLPEAVHRRWCRITGSPNLGQQDWMQSPNQQTSVERRYSEQQAAMRHQHVANQRRGTVFLKFFMVIRQSFNNYFVTNQSIRVTCLPSLRLKCIFLNVLFYYFPYNSIMETYLLEWWINKLLIWFDLKDVLVHGLPSKLEDKLWVRCLKVKQNERRITMEENRNSSDEELANVSAASSMTTDINRKPLVTRSLQIARYSLSRRRTPKYECRCMQL